MMRTLFETFDGHSRQDALREQIADRVIVRH
jgi:hypothetical protein